MRMTHRRLSVSCRAISAARPDHLFESPDSSVSDPIWLISESESFEVIFDQFQSHLQHPTFRINCGFLPSHMASILSRSSEGSERSAPACFAA